MAQTNITSRLYGKMPSMGKRGSFFYVYIFYKDQLKSDKIQLIRKKHHDTHCQMDRLGHSLEEYLNMEEIICMNAKKNQKPLRIILVSNCTLAYQILSYKEKKGGLNIFDQVFICFKKKNQRLASDLMNKYGNKINPQPYSLRHIINFLQSTRSFINLQTSMIKMFYQMNQKDQQFTSLRIRLRILACINLQPALYIEYLEKFKKYLENIYKLQKFSITNNLLTTLQKCIELINNENTDEFSEKILSLYQYSQFYEIVNQSALQLCKKEFNFQQIALPICFVFKSIKLSFKNSKRLEEYAQLFKQDDYITLYRVGYSSKQQTEKWSSKKGKYLENLGILSTSLTKSGALRFLRYKEKEIFNYALFEIKLYKPQFHEIQTMLPFIYQSFALPPQNAFEQQVTLNSLSIFYVTNVTQIPLKKLREKYKVLSETYDWIKFGDYTKLPIIHMECNIFLKKLKNFSNQQEKEKMPLEQLETIRNYIIGVEKLSKIDRYCLADAFLHEKKFQKIKKYKELVSSIVLSTQVSQIQSLRNSIRQSIRDSNIAYQTGNQSEAILNLRKVISLKQDLQTKDKSRCLRESSQDINRYFEKIVKINQNFNCHDQTKKVLNQKINIIRLKLMHHGRQFSDRFQLVELLNILGLYYFRRGNIKQARKNLKESKDELNEIIDDYQNIKKETFYIEWILHFFLKDQKSWEKDKDAFQKQRKSQNIAQITKNFGIDYNFENFVSSSQQLQSNVMQFLQKRQKMIEESQMTLEQKQTSKGKLLQQIEEQFRDSPLLNQLKPKIQDFFKTFEQSKKKFEETIQNGIMKKISNLQAIIIEDCSTLIGAQFKNRFQQIEALREKIINDLIKQWLNQKKGNIPIQQIIQKIHIQIISLRYNYFHMYRKQMKKHYQNTKDLNQETISIIQKYHNEAKKFKSWEPSFQILLMNCKQSELYIQAERIQQAEGLLSSLVEQSKENSFFATILFDSYEMLIRIYEDKADISYINCLDFTTMQNNPDLNISIKRMSSVLVAKGEGVVTQALKALEKIKNQEVNDTFSNQIENIHLKLKLFEQKFLILQSTLSSGSSKNHKMKAIQHKKIQDQIEQNSKLLKSYKLQQSGRIVFDMIHYYSQTLFYYDSDWQLSLSNMIESLKLSQNLIPCDDKLNALMAGFMLFSNKNPKNLEDYIEDLIRYEQQMTNYSYYWKITLSLYIYYKFKQDCPQKRIQYIHKTHYFRQSRQQTLKKTQQKITIPISKIISYEFNLNNKLQPLLAYRFSSINKQKIPKRLSIQENDGTSQIFHKRTIKKVQQDKSIGKSSNHLKSDLLQQKKLKRQYSSYVPHLSQPKEAPKKKGADMSLQVQEQYEADNPEQKQFQQSIEIINLQSLRLYSERFNTQPNQQTQRQNKNLRQPFQQNIQSKQKQQKLMHYNRQGQEGQEIEEQQHLSKSKRISRRKYTDQYIYTEQFIYFLKTGEKIQQNMQVQSKIISQKTNKNIHLLVEQNKINIFLLQQAQQKQKVDQFLPDQ